MQGPLLDQGFDFLVIEALHPGWASEAAPPFPGATVRANGRGRRRIGDLAAGKLGRPGLGRRTAPGGLARLAHPVRDLAQWRRDEGVGDVQNDRIDERDTALAPMLATLEKLLFSLRVQGPTGQEQRRVVGIQQGDGNQLAGFDQLISAPVYQFVEDRLEALGRNRSPAEPHAADDRAEGVGDFFGPVAQVGLGGLLDPQVLLDLPAEDQHPDGHQESVHQ